MYTYKKEYRKLGKYNINICFLFIIKVCFGERLWIVKGVDRDFCNDII